MPLSPLSSLSTEHCLVCAPARCTTPTSDAHSPPAPRSARLPAPRAHFSRRSLCGTPRNLSRAPQPPAPCPVHTVPTLALPPPAVPQSSIAQWCTCACPRPPEGMVRSRRPFHGSTSGAWTCACPQSLMVGSRRQFHGSTSGMSASSCAASAISSSNDLSRGGPRSRSCTCTHAMVMPST